MKRTVELVNQWGNYCTAHPEATIADFCRYYLAKEGRAAADEEREKYTAGLAMQIRTESLMLRMIGRINKINMTYAKIALEGTGLTQMEEFGLLIAIQQLENPKKSEVISANLLETSSGTDMLQRLITKGLIAEADDPNDKRSKNLTLTKTGSKTLSKAKGFAAMLAKMITYEMKEEDKLLCIQLLKNLELRLASRLADDKGKTFQEIYKELVPDERRS